MAANTEKFHVVVVTVVVRWLPEPVRQPPIWGRGGKISRRDEEFHQTHIVLEHICDVNRITEVTLAFCCQFWAEQ